MIMIPKQGSWVAYTVLLVFLMLGTVALVRLRPKVIKSKARWLWRRVSFHEV